LKVSSARAVIVSSHPFISPALTKSSRVIAISKWCYTTAYVAATREILDLKCSLTNSNVFSAVG